MTENTPQILRPFGASTWSMVRRLVAAYLRPYFKTLAGALFFMFLAAAMTAAFAKLIQPVLDDVLVSRKENMVIPMAIAVFSVFFINGISSYLHTVMMNRIGQSIVTDVQRDLFSRFMDLDLKFFHENPSGQLIARMISDVQVMRTAVSESLTGIGESFMTLIFLAILMFSQDAKLALISFCVFPPAAVFVSHLGRRLRKVSKSIQKEIGGVSDSLSQIFLGMRQVKAYSTENFERDRFARKVESVRNMYFKSYRIGNLSTPVNQTLIGIALTVVIIYGGRQAIKGELTVGELMSFIAAFSLSYEPLKKLAKLNNNLQTGLGAAERVFDMLDRRASIVNRPGAREVKLSRPEIVFDHVTFAYGFDEGHALRDVSFTAAAGKVTALVGPSGSGKTTAMNLVPRLYEATSGRVLVGGVDVRDITLESLRGQIALVSQDITIFDDSVRANIAYGRPDATDAEVEAAARAAAAEEFIRSLPESYATRLGEQGVKLSGGQRQRIAIARAILRDAPILLLDEATSALDNESERAIQASLEKLQKGRTTLVIAHRLSTVQNADHIIVLERGRVAEMASHEELMGKSGIYARMHAAGISG